MEFQVSISRSHATQIKRGRGLNKLPKEKIDAANTYPSRSASQDINQIIRSDQISLTLWKDMISFFGPQSCRISCQRTQEPEYFQNLAPRKVTCMFQDNDLLDITANFKSLSEGPGNTAVSGNTGNIAVSPCHLP